MMLNWNNIQTVLLDMDGTLLDLNFDTHIWLEHLPKRVAEKQEIDLDEAKMALYSQYKALEGTMDWYCLDYWSQTLDMDIPLLKEEVTHLIAIHPYVSEFLDAIRKIGKRAVLVTNAHQKSLSLKMKHTPIGDHLDAVISAHELGLPKEQMAFWTQLQGIEAFNASQTLLIDDNFTVLQSAKQYGIKYLLAIHQPDTQKDPKKSDEFTLPRSFKQIITPKK